MGNDGELIAADISDERAKRLAENLKRLGVMCARPETADLLASPLPNWARPGSFDRILLDAPCSNTGVLRRRADARWRLMPGFARQMQELQTNLARALLPLLNIALGADTASMLTGVASPEQSDFERIVLELLDSVMIRIPIGQVSFMDIVASSNLDTDQVNLANKRHPFGFN